MNSMSRGYYESCGKERKREEEKCQTIIKCGCPSTAQVLTTVASPTDSATIASLTVDNFCLCDPITKLEFATIISTAANGFAGTVSLRIFKQCRHQFTPVPIGPAWTVTVAAASTLPLSFFICDSDSCENDCCTYTVVATATETASGIVTFNNSTLGAISTCKSNKCKEKCREKEEWR
ncbi:DUF4489 domain-containing protein [uncultured Clostridium sp.]|uniref:DUF4489 domain-containing protein n=1 Tax=uncultured Clostridium sp. TaxID=59620 RepID=UPI0025E88009|nr:DUF4489 domain-containing protein [uncultured Clostridium sp.]